MNPTNDYFRVRAAFDCSSVWTSTAAAYYRPNLHPCCRQSLSSSPPMNSSSESFCRAPSSSSEVPEDFLRCLAGETVLLRNRELIWLVRLVVGRSRSGASSLVSSVGRRFTVVVVNRVWWWRHQWFPLRDVPETSISGRSATAFPSCDARCLTR